MLFSTRFHEPIRRGEVTVTFRRWRRPQAREGGRYRLHTGAVIEVTRVAVVGPEDVADADARRAGFASAEEVLGVLRTSQGELYRVQFRYLGDLPDERAALAADDDLSVQDHDEIAQRLARMDGGGRGPWTRTVLRLIEENEGLRAADLAVQMGQETRRFKADVRRLKALGLTESLEVGYRLSPRGRALLVLDAEPTHSSKDAASEDAVAGAAVADSETDEDGREA